MNYSEVINRIKRGDRKAERLLFDHLAPRLLNMCRRYAHDDAMAKDYFQDSFIRVFEKLDKFDAKRGPFESWCFKVALNVILSNKRTVSRKLQIDYVEEIPETPLFEEDLQRITDEELVACIQQLPDGYREVINLYIFEELSHSEIGKLLDISTSTSRTQYMRAKQLMKRILKKSIPDLYERKLA